MQFGFFLSYPSQKSTAERNSFDAAAAVARAAEEAGFESVWMPDHFMFVEKDYPHREIEVPECFSMLAAVAACTERVKLGPYVAGVPYRSPALVAKMFSTLDVISHGRVIVGLGAAWHGQEFEAYGFPFPPVKERMERLEEAVQIVELMLTQSPATFSGRHYSIKDALNYPQPVQKPRPAIMIGGGGEKHTLRLVAKYADMSNIWSGDPATTRHKFEVLRKHCEEIGRPYEEIVRTKQISVMLAKDEAELARKQEKHTSFETSPPIVGTPDAVMAGLEEYARAGVQQAIIDMPDAADLEPIHLFAETVMPALAET